MSEKKRLGRGLGALIPEVMEDSSEQNEILLEKIKPNPFQPRREFDETKLKELTASVKEHGILQAVVVTPEGESGNYTLVAGERRCRAARLAGLKTVPAVVRSVDSKTMLEIALIENLQREDLNPVDEALAYRRLIKEYSYTQDELAQRIGCSRPAIANSIRLLYLPESVLDALYKNKMTPGQVRPLLSISDQEKQEEAAKRIMNEKLTAREAEKIATQINSRDDKKEKVSPDRTTDPLQEELQLQIQRTLGTKVKIKKGKTGGTIEIFYYGDDDLERLVAKLLPDGI
ncbi:MAG: ParB/RepB/Spo0J family partition protein [Bacillota bacterium]